MTGRSTNTLLLTDQNSAPIQVLAVETTVNATVTSTGTSVLSRITARARALSKVVARFRESTYSDVGMATSQETVGTTKSVTQAGTGTLSSSQVYTPGSGVIVTIKRLVRAGLLWVNRWR